MLSLPALRALGPPRSYAAAVLLVLLAMGAAVVFRRLPHANLPLLFLLVVLIVAARWGLWPAIFSSLLGFVALNLFFTAPRYTLAVEEQGDVATLVFFLVMATLTGNLAARMHNEMAGSRAALERVSALLDFSRRMAAATTAPQVLQALVDRVARTLQTPAAAMLADDTRHLWPCAQNLTHGGPAFSFEDAQTAWRSSGGASIRSGAWTYLRLATAGGPIGLLALGTTGLRHEQRQVVDALVEQASIAVERTRLVDDLRKAQVESETERLRSALLASVSHDLRTPLASIIGSVTSLIEYGEAMKREDRGELLQTVRDESERLDRYIQNLLDMTRFGRPELSLQREWVDLNDLIAGAVKRLGGALSANPVCVDVAADAALILVQGALIEQVLVNLLDNAADFSPPGGRITLAGRAEDGVTIVEVLDEGPGIPPADRDKVFDLFYRAQQGDRSRQGTGLGLAICRSVVLAHGGTIEALANPSGGTCMRIVLPQAAEPSRAAQHG